MGRIDGGIPVKARADILRRSRVVIVTPDIIHAWMLNNLNEASTRSFLKKVALIVVDEVHTYTGVFGSNAAFLFRRLQHTMRLLDSQALYFCASATISKPQEHVARLFGINFRLVDEEYDTSPRNRVGIHLVTPPPTADLLSQICTLVSYVGQMTTSKLIAFVDSRKQTEHISSILARTQRQEDSEEEASIDFDYLRNLNILPFRSGYADSDRRVIQDRLTTGGLRGVISTSALELGIDISDLGTGILVGVPRSSTSLRQRIGRIGRHGDGNVIVMNTGSIYDEAIFNNPDEILTRPAAEGALYLQNQRIQYIHALCLARRDGEHDQVCSAMNKEERADFVSEVDWPQGFLDLCNRERLGQSSTDLQSMKGEAGDCPNRVFPLRDTESQFQIELKQGPEQKQLGSLSYGQVMRETYPGGIYRHIAMPYRIYRVDTRSKTVQVRHDKNYTTKPAFLPTLIYPNLTAGNVYYSAVHDTLSVFECNLNVTETVCGFQERRGGSETSHRYPLYHAGVSYQQGNFKRNYFSSGVIVTHPVLSWEGVNCDKLMQLIYEAFLMLVPFERQDINIAWDKHRADAPKVEKGNKFIALYDQTYGSLRLSGRIVEDSWLQKTLLKAIELCDNPEILDVDKETASALVELHASALVGGSKLSFDTDAPMALSDQYVRVIKPGSKGLIIDEGCPEEFEVERVLFYPPKNGLCYRGWRSSRVDDNVVSFFLSQLFPKYLVRVNSVIMMLKPAMSLISQAM